MLLSEDNDDIYLILIAVAVQKSMIQTDVLQVAQLLQRDRAVGWVSYGQKLKTGTVR